MTIHKGTTLSVVNQGGEPHTFTEVSQFGGGFIEPLNHGEATVPECADGFHNVAVARTRILQGSRFDVTGLQGATGSTIGPGGALYVTEGAADRISRVDPQTGEITTFASGLPKMIPAVGVGGAIDVAFIGKTAYVLVTLVSPDVGGSDVDGIYRVDGPDSFIVVANIGQFNLSNPPTIPFPFFVPTGVQYALQTYRGGFLVTDGLNRVLRVTLDGEVSVLIAFGDVVPTGQASATIGDSRIHVPSLDVA